MTGPKFELAYRYAQVMSTLFVCLTFSTGMPLLNLVAALNFLACYCVDKFLFSNLYRTPQSSYRIGEQVCGSGAAVQLGHLFDAIISTLSQTIKL